MSASDAIRQAIWAIDPRWLPILSAIADRREDDPALIAARAARPLDKTYSTTIRDGVAVVPIMGPIFPRANMMTAMSGATSLQMTALDFNAALDNPDVKAVLLQIDSPGGVAFGVNEFAAMVRAGVARKPVVAYVMGQACSAAYWIASAAAEIVIDATAMLGSIGVVSGASVQVEPDAQGNLLFDIVSSNAPNKRPDPRTDAGRAAMVASVDQIETVFIDAIAAYRGVDRAKVIADFGQGGVLIGQAAVSAGMADAVGSFEATIARLARAPAGVATPPSPNSQARQTTTKEKTMPITLDTLMQDNPALVEQLRAEGRNEGRAAGEAAGAAAERARILALQEMALEGHEEALAAAIADGKTTPDSFARQIVLAEKKTGGRLLADLRTDGGTAAPAHAPAGTRNPQADPAAPLEDRCKAEWEASPELRAEFGNEFKTYLAYSRATAAGRVKIMGRAA